MNQHKKILETALLAGQIMTESNAESYRVEDTMNRILTTSKAEYAVAVSLSTSLYATLDDAKFEYGGYTGIKRIDFRKTNLNRISQVNTISRNYTGGRITVEQAHDKLAKLRLKTNLYSSPVTNIGIVGLCTSFAVLFGGGLSEISAALFNGILLAFLYRLTDRYFINQSITNIMQSFVVTLFAYTLKFLIFKHIDIEIVIIATLMPMVPGTAITNSFRDIFREDYLAGGARAVEAFVEALMIALGAAIGLAVLRGTLW